MIAAVGDASREGAPQAVLRAVEGRVRFVNKLDSTQRGRYEVFYALRHPMPARLRILHIGRDFVLGPRVDSPGVERVRVHGLNRGR